MKCQNCGEMGHTKVRCKKEAAAPDNSENDVRVIEDSGDWVKETATTPGSGDGGGWDTTGAGDSGDWKEPTAALGSGDGDGWDTTGAVKW